MEEKPIGKVTHYFDKIQVAAIELSDALKAGDKIHVKGGQTDFEQMVDSMQIEHATVAVAETGQTIGMKMASPAKENDLVYKVIAE